MAQVELIMPKMGESIMEATILKWVKQVGDTVEEDETILEIATDKVDSEVPSPVDGVIAELLFEEGETVEIGKAIALIQTEAEVEDPEEGPSGRAAHHGNGSGNGREAPDAEPALEEAVPEAGSTAIPATGPGERFYSPLVRNIAAKENISLDELKKIEGSGLQGRVTKKDILAFIKRRGDSATTKPQRAPQRPEGARPVTRSVDGEVEVIEMDRMRKLIAGHMVRSVQTSPHVTSFVEVDVTTIVTWRERVKGDFQKRHGFKLTYTPIFVEAVARAITDFPMINVSVEDDKILVKKDINVGMAVAIPNGNLIVPVIRQADRLNLLGLAEEVNDLALRARDHKLKAEEIQGGTFTLTNVGTFGNVMGTPIINQPQVAIMAVGAIRKKPAVVETEYGDLIAVRHMMFLSLSYDHRVVDGFLGGSFLRRVGDYLEQFDAEQKI